MKTMVGCVLLFLTVVSVMVVAHARPAGGQDADRRVGPNEGWSVGPDRTARQRWVAARLLNVKIDRLSVPYTTTDGRYAEARRLGHPGAQSHVGRRSDLRDQRSRIRRG